MVVSGSFPRRVVESLTSNLNNFGRASPPTSLVRTQHPTRELVVGPRRQEGEKLNLLAPGILQGLSSSGSDAAGSS